MLLTCNNMPRVVPQAESHRLHTIGMYNEADLQIALTTADKVKFAEQMSKRAGRFWGYLEASLERLQRTADEDGILPMLIAGAKAIGYDKVMTIAYQLEAYSHRAVCNLAAYMCHLERHIH